MIEKMKFLTVTGPRESLDDVIDKYLSKYEFQLENALTELKNIKNLTPYTGFCPYRDLYNRSEELLKLAPTAEKALSSPEKMQFSEAEKIVAEADALNNRYNEETTELNDAAGRLKTYLTHIEPFLEIDYNIRDVLHFRFIRYGFGKMPKEYYAKYMRFVDHTIDAIFVKTQETRDYVWGAYFVPTAQYDKVDSIFSSLHFEKFRLPEEYDGTAKEVYQQISTELEDVQQKQEQITECFQKEFSLLLPALFQANETLYTLTQNFDVRKMVACTTQHQTEFFILCGWMPETQAKQFIRESRSQTELYLFMDDKNSTTTSKPPTKLKNLRLIRPFEMFVEMYGLPSYNEIDPTLFVALTYAFIFGIMFGDVGQGILLCIGGFLLYKLKGMRLAAIIGFAGIFSTLFGFMFGSFFGFENVLAAVWLRPGTDMMLGLPLMGNMNTVLVAAIAFGMFLIIVTMVMHIVNGIKAHRAGEIFFDANALAGLVFYLSLTVVIVLIMTGKTLPGTIILLIMFVAPLILIALKEPLTNLIERKSRIFPKEKGMFIVQTFFEMFEVLLSYLSNTISFVRIGAFAISHGAMMEVVLLLAGAESGSPNWIVVVLGNILVCGLEGLIVGIQVLRLEYYEMFSRFYSGNGRPFKPYVNKKFK